MYQTLKENNLGTFQEDYYWSSTEESSSNAYVFWFGEGRAPNEISRWDKWGNYVRTKYRGKKDTFLNYKTVPSIYSVRAVRSFNLFLDINRLASLVRGDLNVEIQKRASSAGITLTINSFDLLHKGGQEYSGILKTIEAGEEYTYQVDVTVDGDSYMWKIVK